MLPSKIGGKNEIHLDKFWSLIDEHPKSERGNPILIDLGTWKIYNPTDQIGAVTALQFVPKWLKIGGKTISCLKRFSSFFGSNQEQKIDQSNLVVIPAVAW